MLELHLFFFKYLFFKVEMTKPFVFLFLFIDTGEAEAEEINSKLLNRESGINQKARKRKQIK